MKTFTPKEVIGMVAEAVNELAGRNVSVTIGDEKRTISLKNFVLRNVAYELRRNSVPDEDVETALEGYDEVVKEKEPIAAVGLITGGRRKTRKTRRHR